MSTSITTAILPTPLPPVRLPLVLLKKARGTKLEVDPAVAEHFTPEELRAASEWQGEHPEVPAIKQGEKVYPDPITDKIQAELKRLNQRRVRVLNDANVDAREPVADHNEQTAEERAEKSATDDGEGLSGDDYDALIDSAADGIGLSGEIMARIQAASVAGRKKRRRDRSSERFMSAIDGYVEPYLAIQRGMSLGEAARTFGIADVQRHLADVEMWLSLCEQFPKFNRSTFLARLERAVEKRRRDEGIGAERAAAEKAAFNKPEEESAAKRRGSEWATIEHIPRVVSARKPPQAVNWDLPWSGQPSQPYRRTQEPRAQCVVDLVREPMVRLPPSLAITIPQSHTHDRRRELEQGLLFILETMPYCQHRCELVDAVDLALAGMRITEIASKLGVSSATVKRRLAEVNAACHENTVAKKKLNRSES